MGDDSQIRYKLRALRRAKTWQLLVVLIPLLFVSATFLRLNNLGMIERRDAVKVADEKGNQQDIKKKLTDLQHYVSTHMNASLDKGIVLENSYKRDRAAAIEAATNATNASNPNSSVYQQASVECRERFQGGTASFRNDYVQCVVARVQSLGQGQAASTDLKLPVSGNYRYNFSSPSFSFDFAGISILICGLLIGVIVFRLLAIFFLQTVLKYRQKHR